MAAEETTENRQRESRITQRGWEKSRPLDFLPRQVAVDGVCPFFAVFPVGLAEVPDVNICLSIEGRAFVGGADPGAVCVNRSKMNIDLGHHDAVNDRDVLYVAFLQIKDGSDPDALMLAVRHGKDRAGLVLRGLRLEELRLPIRSAPDAFRLRSKQRRRDFVRSADGELEGVAHVRQWL